ncbi:MAG TPA: hypothetical protein VLT87_05740 [Thermoanaerobaculia bacterium]|nr:hypothetical protein [Thermoanaerobaculia bacterium]
MAVLWIKELVTDYNGRVKFNQPDTKWKPELLAQTLPAGEDFWFPPAVTQWKTFVIPWAEKGSLRIDTIHTYECTVGPTAADPNNDYLQVSSPTLPSFNVFLGPKGYKDFYCTLTIKSDGKISFDNVSP